MPSLKQEIAVKKLVESGGALSVSAAMREAGYSPKTAKTPKKLTESSAWQKLLDKYIPDEKLMKVQAEGLEATKVISAYVTGKDADSRTNDFIDVPDYATRHRYLETGLKLKGKTVEQPSNPTQVNIIITRGDA